MKSFLLILFTFSISFGSGQAPEIEWQKCLGGTASEIANSVQQTSDGGYIVAGYTWSNDGDVTGNHGISDCWIVKLDADGGLVWQKSLGGSGDDQANSIQQISDGGYVVAGFTSSNDDDVTGNHGKFDYWVVKLDADGGLVWQKSLGGTSLEIARSVQQTSDGSYIVAGFTWSNDGDVTGNQGDFDYWVVKLDAEGDLIWQKSLGGTDQEGASTVQQTSDGGYIAAGYTWSNDGDVTGNHGDSDCWIVKLDADGGLVWQKSLGGTDREGASSVQQTSDGGYVVSGSAYSNNGDVTGNHGDSDCWIVKLDADGGLVWQKSLGGSGDDQANSIQQISDGGYVVAGYTSSNDGDVTGNHGDSDCWIVKLDAEGDLIWQKSLGGSGDDQANSIQQTSDGSYIVAGFTWSNDGDVTGNHGARDYWVVKISSAVEPSEMNLETLSLFPNPVYEKFTLSTEPDAIGNSFTVVDRIGKVILEGKITSESMVLDVSSFAKGVYHLSVQNEQGSLEIVKQ